MLMCESLIGGQKPIDFCQCLIEVIPFHLYGVYNTISGKFFLKT